MARVKMDGNTGFEVIDDGIGVNIKVDFSPGSIKSFTLLAKKEGKSVKIVRNGVYNNKFNRLASTQESSLGLEEAYNDIDKFLKSSKMVKVI